MNLLSFTIPQIAFALTSCRDRSLSSRVASRTTDAFFSITGGESSLSLEKTHWYICYFANSVQPISYLLFFFINLFLNSLSYKRPASLWRPV